MDIKYERMYEYVSMRFNEGYSIRIDPYRHKLHHTKRVIGWIDRIGEAEGGDLDILRTAAIFHDVGYAVTPNDHPSSSANIARRYLMDNGYQSAYIQQVCKMIKNHDDRSLLLPSTPINQLILIEADNLDEKGAMAVLRDAMGEGNISEQSYEKTYARIRLHFEHTENNIMVTPTARRYWDDKQAMLRSFLCALEIDMGLA